MLLMLSLMLISVLQFLNTVLSALWMFDLQRCLGTTDTKVAKCCCLDSFTAEFGYGPKVGFFLNICEGLKHSVPSPFHFLLPNPSP